LVIDSITRHRTDGSFVRLIAPVTNDNEAMALELLTDFAELIIPALNEHIPSQVQAEQKTKILFHENDSCKIDLIFNPF